MKKTIQQFILQSTGASSFRELEVIQSLWSGYGNILRLQLTDAACDSIVVKHISFANEQAHPRGWNTDLSHQRKLHSYHVEMAWYRQWSNRCDGHCRIPQFLGAVDADDEFLIMMEDLDASNYPRRLSAVDMGDIKLCVSWLANFHAQFLSETPECLWTIGTYWHLDTRPDEWQALSDSKLKQAASVIDKALLDCPWQTIVHGDAKLANFCFNETGDGVAAVDFQYVGGGCGMKDLAYFLGSCLNEADCKKHESE